MIRKNAVSSEKVYLIMEILSQVSSLCHFIIRLSNYNNNNETLGFFS